MQAAKGSFTSWCTNGADETVIIGSSRVLFDIDLDMWQQLVPGPRPIDLAIVDLYIPVLDGLTLIQRIREAPETTTMKVLAISASITDARHRSLSAGADQFLQKPIRMVDVIDAVCTLLRLDPP